MRNKSFTLIELLVVIVIIGILAGVIIVSTSSSINKASIAKMKVFEESIKNSLPLNLILEWSFDNITDYNSTTKIVGSTPNNIIDSWGSNHGTAFNGPLLKEGDSCVNKKCLEFDGTNHLAIYMPINPTEFTISIWVKNPNLGYVLRSNANARTYMHKSGTFSKGDPQVYLGSSIYSKEWTHVVMTWKKESGQLKGQVFVNSKALTSDFVNFSNETPGTYLSIMSFTAEGEQFANGMVDEVKLFDKTLPTAQIKQEYIAGLNSLLASNSISKEEYDQRLNNLAYDKE